MQHVDGVPHSELTSSLPTHQDYNMDLGNITCEQCKQLTGAMIVTKGALRFKNFIIKEKYQWFPKLMKQMISIWIVMKHSAP